MSECEREASAMRRPWPTRGCCAMGGGGKTISYTNTTTGTLIERGHNTLMNLRKTFFTVGYYNYLGTN